MNEFETAVVNELSVFEPLKFYCIWMYCAGFNGISRYQSVQADNIIIIIIKLLYTFFILFNVLISRDGSNCNIMRYIFTGPKRKLTLPKSLFVKNL